MITQSDIAKECGVSIAAVSSAYHHPGMISAKTRQKILEVARRLGYVSKGTQIKAIGLIFNNFKDHYFGEFYNEIIFGITQRACELKIRLQIFDTLPIEYGDVCELSGLMVVGKSTEFFVPEIVRLQMPFLLVDCTNRDIAGTKIYFENSKGVRQLTEYVLNCNHQYLAIMNGEQDDQDITWTQFRKTTEAVLNEKGWLADEHLSVYPVNYSDLQTVEIAINQILNANPRPTCILCTNDLLAYYSYQVLAKYAIRIPDDMSVTGFDGISLPRYLPSPHPVLTTVFSDRIALGMQALDSLMDHIARKRPFPKQITLDTQLKIGDSVKRRSQVPL